ncbi:MAG: FAD-dependent oxidoreductase [Chloroflexota bacterium]|nr:FAD-dependent oxidoreductase [Chloroflexota bacterium]
MHTRLYQPLQIGPREAHNRILFGSHTTNLAQDNKLSSRHADYYAARAEGGAGIIVLEEHIVHPSDFPYERALLGYLPDTPNAIAQVVETIHAHTSLALVQLNHNGQQSVSDHHQKELWAPSAVQDVATREIPKAMELADIASVIEGFALVANYVRQANADGIELQISDRSLLRQFLSPLTNVRTDTYGGSLENRLRFVHETIEAVKSALGTDRILGVRLCADEMAPWAGLTPEQSIEIARVLAETGRVDYFTVTMGSIFSTQMFPFHASMHIPRGYAVQLATSIKSAVSIPVFAAGRIMTAHQAEQILVEEQADGVEMIRALIADPHLPRLSLEGRANEVRPCISCNQGCQVRTVMNLDIGCNVNPNVIHPSPSTLPIAIGYKKNDTKTGTVLIVGGGPAGMEAARTAALRGKRVILSERENRLGGALALAAKGAGRGELQLITDYLQAQIEQLDVEIHLGVDVTAEEIVKQQPETVIVATGAHPAPGLLAIPGSDLPHVTNIRRILGGEAVEGQRVVVIDETESHGLLSVAELLATRGQSVEIVTEDFYVGRDLVPTHDLVLWMQRVMALGVEMTPHTTLVRIEPGQVIVTDKYAAGERSIVADAVVLGTYERPSQALYYALKGRVPRLLRAGDCVAPRRIAQAIVEGREVGEFC